MHSRHMGEADKSMCNTPHPFQKQRLKLNGAAMKLCTMAQKTLLCYCLLLHIKGGNRMQISEVKSTIIGKVCLMPMHTRQLVPA